MERSVVTYAPLYSLTLSERTVVTALETRLRETVTSAIVRRPLVVAERAILQLASSVVRGDPIKSLVELITNSDDSYRRMDSNHDPSYGRIIVNLDRAGNGFTVLDFAEGMDGKSMDECVGTYGGEASGIERGHSVRGFYGRGLKEAILGLGFGDVRSIKNGHLYECYLKEDGTYTRNKPRTASASDYLNLGIPRDRNGTKVHVSILRLKRLPPWAWMSYALSHHYSLRDIMQSSQRRVILTNGERSEILRYEPPAGKLILSERRIGIPGYKATVDLNLYLADGPLSQEGYTRNGGVIIRSRNAIHESTLFRFDYNPYASRIFGEARCDYIDELMSKGELVVNDKRDGLDHHHPFTKVLRRVIENELQPIIEQEAASQNNERRGMSESLRRRLTNVLWEVNKLAIRLLKVSALHQAATNQPSDRPQERRGSNEERPGRNRSYPILFRGIRLNSYQDPKVRVTLDKGTGIINIAKKAPSVAMYYESSQDSPEFLTLAAELISDAVFLELAETISNTNGTEAVSSTFSDLKSRYSHLIHKCMQSDRAGMLSPADQPA
jgi:hypothetical protein